METKGTSLGAEVEIRRTADVLRLASETLERMVEEREAGASGWRLFALAGILEERAAALDALLYDGRDFDARPGGRIPADGQARR